MPSAKTMLLQAFQADLTAAGLARRPGVAGSAPPLWMEPSDGAPAPGEKAGVENDAGTVLTVFAPDEVLGGGNWQQQHEIDVWVRTKGNGAVTRAYDVEQAIRDRIIGADEFRIDFDLAPGTPQAMRIIEARVYAGLRRLGSDPEQGYTHLVSYALTVYRTGVPGG